MDYISSMVDLTGDPYLNPQGAVYGDGSGTHQRNVNTITSISVHHDAMVREHDYDSIARYKAEAASHYERLGPGLQYHYKIDNTGTIFKIRPHTTWLYVVGSAENTSTVAICLDGYFHEPFHQKPTREQYEALGQLLIKLCEQSPEFPATYPDVRPHRDFSSTACPGDYLAPWVYAIESKADVLNVPVDAIYDWPQYQSPAPGSPATPTEPDHGPASHPVEEVPPVPVPTTPAPQTAPEVPATPEAPVPTAPVPTPSTTPETPTAPPESSNASDDTTNLIAKAIKAIRVWLKNLFNKVNS